MKSIFLALFGGICASVILACGSTDGDSGANTGGANTSGANTGGANTGGANTGGANTGGANTGGTNTGGAAGAVQCPATVPSAYQNIDNSCTLGNEACSYNVECKSGTVAFELMCSDSGKWMVAPTACVKPYDSCGDLYCDGVWRLPVSGDPPQACPSKPANGDECVISGFGGLVSPCGYPCDAVTKTGWTVATCIPDAAGTLRWSFDNACG